LFFLSELLRELKLGKVSWIREVGTSDYSEAVREIIRTKKGEPERLPLFTVCHLTGVELVNRMAD